jgi:O-antigen/teichoic acid export membrane protein
MGQARFSLESLAVLPVVNSLVFIFRSSGLSYQETALTMLGRGWFNYRVVRNFAILLSLGATAGLALIAWTPLATVWLQTVSGLTGELSDFALKPIRILTLMPMLSVMLSFQRSLLVARRNTGPITWASAIEVAGILAVLFVTIRLGDWIGATAAATAFMIGRLMSNTFLVGQTSRES